jgi:hypothetical protein
MLSRLQRVPNGVNSVVEGLEDTNLLRGNWLGEFRRLSPFVDQFQIDFDGVQRQSTFKQGGSLPHCGHPLDSIETGLMRPLLLWDAASPTRSVPQGSELLDCEQATRFAPVVKSRVLPEGRVSLSIRVAGCDNTG